MGSCAAPSAKGDDKFITTDYLQQCQYIYLLRDDIFISKMLQIHHHETDHRKQVTRLGIPFRPEHPYDTHARLLLL
ncbi:hypothetical protein EAI64_24795 [Escherichia coli]|nr:hypothetical protein [Escherichia coli]MCH7033838.1 hypothetical protein [Escherichia coli]RLW99212.1 hypothetical protein EAI65_24925 [Escherichia coli]RLX01930.1 hypothetical protein EAI64_24795 [Escherichia coli]